MAISSLSPQKRKSLNDGIPLLPEATDIVPTLPLHIQANILLTKAEYVATPLGSVWVIVQGDISKPAIVTYHDVGLNGECCFTTFLKNQEMVELSSLFCWYHMTAPGQERNAQDLSNTVDFPSMTQLAEQLEHVVCHYELSYFIGLGVGAGANILSRYAILTPEKVRGLVLINLCPSSLSLVSPSYYYAKVMEWLLKKELLPERVKKYFTENALKGSPLTECKTLTATYHSYFTAINPHNLGLFLHSFIERTSITAIFSSRIRCPCMFVVNNDLEDTQDIINLASTLDPGKVSLLELDSSCSLVLEENPQKVIVALQLFLQGLGHAVTLGMSTATSQSEHGFLETTTTKDS